QGPITGGLCQLPPRRLESVVLLDVRGREHAPLLRCSSKALRRLRKPLPKRVGQRARQPRWVDELDLFALSEQNCRPPALEPILRRLRQRFARLVKGQRLAEHRGDVEEG